MEFSKAMDAIKPSDIREMSKLTANPEIISFAGGVPDPSLFPVEALAEATAEVFAKSAKRALQYSSTEGYLPLREKIVQMLAKKGIETNTDEILLLTGAQQGIEFAGKVFLDPDDAVLCESPSYSGAVNAYLPYRPRFIEVPVDDEGISVEMLAKILKEEKKPRLIYVIPNFQNPAGRTWSLNTRTKFMELMEKYDIPIVEDDPYGDLIFEGESLPTLKSLDKKGNVIYLGSFSKILCPGLRTGWVCAKEDILRKFVVVKQCADIHSNSLVQEILDVYLEHNDIYAQIEKIKNLYRTRKDLMLQEIEKNFPAECTYTSPNGGMFIWVEMPKECNTREILKAAIAEKVAFIPGGGFFPNGENESCLRLNFSTMPEDRIIEGIRRLGRILKESVASKKGE